MEHAAGMGVTMNAYKILVGKLLQKWPPGKLRRWEDNVKMHIREKVVWMGNGWNWLSIVTNGCP
jgi:hypothetical protein